ncbi:MAG: hypothetical protein CHKLHMKO_00518 [Candidatus Argoarchaeum ethanivorans]|uniref:Uncharacterized protein n=1 Tax=Candidatus Argoarchaeum ethanivorans TaxID=2608793 RepID=A0A811TG02_9EURY|nr:MAG: hypothetical protein CHKLHMKO_00518 [Candidatus Argoarchaeum ethanivorans]
MYAFVGVLKRLKASFRRKLRFLMLIDFVAVTALFYGIFFYLDVESRVSRFAAGNLPFSAAELLIVVSVALSFVLILFFHRGDKHRNIVQLIEKKSPVLHEKLETAYDNREKKNLVMDSLSEEVNSSLTVVHSSALISKRGVLLKLMFAFTLVFGSMFITINDEHVDPDVISEISKVAKTLSLAKEENSAADNESSDDFLAATDEFFGEGEGGIYGKPTIARLTGKKIDLLLYSGSGAGLELRSADDTRLYEFEQTPVYPADAVASGTSDDYATIAAKSDSDKLIINRYAVEMSGQ